MHALNHFNFPKQNFCNLIFLLLFLVVAPISYLQAKDIIRINLSKNPKDQRIIYKMKLLKHAMDLTQKEYGPYEIKMADIPPSPKRAIAEIKSGVTINTFIAVTSRQWEAHSIPIRIPLRRGILAYRLLAINKTQSERFSNLKSFEELQPLKAGMRNAWVTTKIFKSQQFNMIGMNTLNELYSRLESGSIDYIPRGINEIYDEIKIRSLKNVKVADNIMLYLPAPTYVFVSPREKHLAKRIENGLELLVANGALKNQFYEFYSDHLRQANINMRKAIISFPNGLPPQTPTERKELWFNYDKELENLYN